VTNTKLDCCFSKRKGEGAYPPPEVGKDKQHSLHLQIPPLQKYLPQRSQFGKHQRDIDKFNDLLMDKTSMRKK
jgi:hypothetical protein